MRGSLNAKITSKLPRRRTVVHTVPHHTATIPEAAIAFGSTYCTLEQAEVCDKTSHFWACILSQIIYVLHRLFLLTASIPLRNENDI